MSQNGRTPLEWAKEAELSDELIKLLEDYAHVNEFATAVLACDLRRMMHFLSLGISFPVYFIF